MASTMVEEKSLPSGSRSPTLDARSEPSVNEKDTNHGANTLEQAVENYMPEQVDEKAVIGEDIDRVQTREEGIEYPSGMKLALISLALCLSVLLMALDNTIISTAIPRITDEFNSLPDVGWYGSAYLLTTAAFQLLFGKLYSFFSIKYVYLTAIGIFELGSLVCGAAPNSTALIIGRAVAGLGSAGIFSGALIIIAYSVPLQKRPMYTGFIGAMYGIASVIGPLLGGVFTDKATWRWCFYINLPIGAVTIVGIAFFFTAPERKAVATLTWKERLEQLDLIGTFFFMPAIICLLLALQWGGSKYPWSDGRVIALFVVFGVLIFIFIGIQLWRGDKATVPPRILSKRSIWASCFFAFGTGSAFFIMLYYVPIWFQSVQGVTAVQSGIRNLPMVLGLVIFSIIAGITVTIVGYYTPFMIIGSIIAAIGAGMLTTLTPDAGEGKWLGYQIIAGVGVGLGMQQPMIAVQTVLDIKDVPTGTSILIFLQTLGSALFVSVGQNVFENKLISGLAQYAPGVDPAIVLSVGATSIQSAPELTPYLTGVTLAYNNALTTTFTVAAAMASISFLGAILVEWKSVKGKKIEMAAA